MRRQIPSGWKSFQIDEICDVVGGGTPERSNPDYWGGSIPWVSPTEVTALKGRYISSTKEKITELGLSKSSAKLHPAGSVLMTSRASIGFAAINSIPVSTNQGFQSFRCREKIQNEFLYQLITWMRPELERLAAGSTFLEISSTNVKSITLVIPEVAEQQKIAAILTSVDEVIESTQAQINKLKDLKTGMMQELLTEGIGHTEFKDSPVGRIPKTWEVATLGSIGNWKGGGTPSKSNPLFWKGEIPWVSPKDMKREFITYTEDYVNDEAIKNSSTNLVPKGSLLIVTRSGILQHTLPVAIAGCDLTINQDIKAVHLKPSFCPTFIYNVLKAFNHKILRACLKAGNTVESLDFDEFSRYLIAYPPLNEQQQIASAVDSVAERIRVKDRQLNHYLEFKKALMNDLLTGKVRVKVISS